jgi:hypothetical protein
MGGRKGDEVVTKRDFDILLPCLRLKKMDYPNAGSNVGVELAIGELKNTDSGPHADKKAGIAMALSTLDLAKSVQLLQLQLLSFSEDLKDTILKSTSSLISSSEQLSASNEKYASGMRFLTIALVVVGMLQVLVSRGCYGLFAKTAKNCLSINIAKAKK